MALYKLTGIKRSPTLGAVQQLFQSIDVDASKAEISFLMMVNMNLFGLKQMFLNNRSVTMGAFKQWYISQGLDWSNFLNILYAK